MDYNGCRGVDYFGKKESLTASKSCNFYCAINNIEGVPVTTDARQLSTQWVYGEIAGEAMVAALIKKHSRSQIVSKDERPVSL